MRGCSCRGTAGFVHLSCLAEQAKILVAEALENNLDIKVKNEKWRRWDTCSLCKQKYHGIVRCALGWACWKTYLGRPETDEPRLLAMGMLGSGLSEAQHHEDALSVKGAELSTLRRVGAPEDVILAVQSNLSNTYGELGRLEDCLRMRREIYSKRLRLNGQEHAKTIIEAHNYASCLGRLKRHAEAKSLLRKLMPVSQRVLGENDETTIAMRMTYATALYDDKGATLDDHREAVTTLEDMQRITRRMLGGAHPLSQKTEGALRTSREVLAVREGDAGRDEGGVVNKAARE